MVVLVRLQSHDRHRSHDYGVKNARIKNHHDGISAMEGDSQFPSWSMRANCQTKFAKACLAIRTDQENASYEILIQLLG